MSLTKSSPGGRGCDHLAAIHQPQASSVIDPDVFGSFIPLIEHEDMVLVQNMHQMNLVIRHWYLNAHPKI